MSSTIYFVRHGEVEHHQSDVSITARGRDQAAAAGEALASRIAEGDTVSVYYSPVRRVQETAQIIYAWLVEARLPRVNLHWPQIDLALSNVRFVFRVTGGERLAEPSQLYDRLQSEAYLRTIPASWNEFYAGFWKSNDPMGYWLTRDSGGGAETPRTVLSRFLARTREVLGANGTGASRTHWIMVTHSGAMRALLRHAFGADPGEPDFCGIITVEPSGEPLRPTLTYRGQSTPLNLAESR